jgi:phage-related minor tail protein
MWGDDPRGRRGRGRLVTKYIGRTVPNATAQVVCTGNGDRVALILAIQPDVAATVSAFVAVGTPLGTGVAPVRTLNVGIPHCAIKLENDGDIVTGAFSQFGTPNILTLDAWEVVWFPE